MEHTKPPGFGKTRLDVLQRHAFEYVARGAPYGPDDGTVAPWVCSRVAAICPGDRAADDPSLSGRLSTDYRQILLEVQLQSEFSEQIQRLCRLDFSLSLRNQSQPGCSDVRKLPVGASLETDAWLPVPYNRTAPSGIYKGMVIISRAMTESPKLRI